MCNKPDIIHCDLCFAISISRFCTNCGQPRVNFIWQPVALDSKAWKWREKLRGSLQSNTGITFTHCDECYSVMNLETDVFCGFCGKYAGDIKWIHVAYRSPEFMRREVLRCEELKAGF